MVLAACLTGHRYLTRPQLVRGRLSAALDGAIAEGFRCFYLGMAPGTDQMAAELLLGRVRVVAVIPCDGYDRLWPASERRRYAGLLSRADEVVLYPGGSYAPWKPHARNRWMVDRSGLVIAVYDGRMRDVSNRGVCPAAWCAGVVCGVLSLVLGTRDREVFERRGNCLERCFD